MRKLWIALFSIIFLAGVQAQINDTWTFAWQNAAIGGLCIPQYIIITQDNTTNDLNVTYSYSSTTQNNNCNSSPFFGSTLNQTNTSVSVYTDAQNNTVTYFNSTPINIQFTLNNTNATFFYLSEDYIYQNTTLGTLGSSWNTPSLSSASSSDSCTCAPDSLFVLPYAQQTPNLQYYSYYITQPNCSQNTTEILNNLTGSTAASINWASPSNISFTFTPSTSTSSIAYTYFNASAQASCTYNYQRNLNASGLLNNGSWVPDWQDAIAFASNLSSYSSYYSVANIDSTYMASTYTYNGQSVQSFLIQNSNGQYQDAYLNQTFTYDQPTNTLTLASADFIYSQSGALFNASQFVELWGTPNTEGNSADCCVFAYVNITQNATNNNTLNVVYTPPEGYDNSSSPCSDYTASYVNGVLEGSLIIEDPSITQLTWIDQVFGTAIAWSGGNTSTIAVQFPNQCAISMVVTSPPSPPNPNPNPNPNPPNPNPNPNPLFGSWISTKAMGLVMGLFVVLACM